MAFPHSRVSVFRAGSALLIVGALGLCGCAVIGPRSITAGRGAYAEVINQTEDQQLLNALVRNRYDQTFGMISVASVTANLRFRTEAGINAGFGDASDYAGNLTPFAAGVAYEENPTISYVPVAKSSCGGCCLPSRPNNGFCSGTRSGTRPGCSAWWLPAPTG
jgi:hypothetical protein